jgi:hypothetical protein
MARKVKETKKENRLEKIRASFIEVPTATTVKAWTFQIEKQFYVVISYNAPRMGPQIAVFPSNKKGVKTSNQHILNINNCKDPDRGLEESLRILVPEEFQEKESELEVTIA